MKTINIDGVEYVKKSDIQNIEIPDGDKSNPFMVVGRDYFIRTVTHYFTGRLVWVGDKEIAMEDVAWIADTGRFNEFVAGKTVNEVEPFQKGVVIIGRGAIIDMSERHGGLCLTVK
ncbi:MAG TPA: hypothetical protein PLN89_01640 [Elusimicrobiota bacterium]|nr:hypothetical protein [Elusimicrobiota bacterium]